MIENISDNLTIRKSDGKVKLSIANVSTNWLGEYDMFFDRLENINLNPVFLDEHLAFEIKVKNILDEAISNPKPSKAIELLDRVIYYDENYAEALINKSYALRQQKHFVKALRYYKKAVKSDRAFEDFGYFKKLLSEANAERDDFPKLKRNIYAGDEYFSKGEYEKAVNNYQKALKDSSRFKDMILFKLLNKTGTAYLKLDDFKTALDCFRRSAEVSQNDYAYFGLGVCQYHLGLDVDDSFKRPLKLSKSQKLSQAMILNDLGFFEESLKICDNLFENHFAVDDFYFRLINVKMYAVRQLGLDISPLEKLLDAL
ncbi:MAG: tetratricopeptide repeat protein [Methanobrevibacter sp.]|nr:tetratricopeptide repeat protein [Methanobrevibacter sp.]